MAKRVGFDGKPTKRGRLFDSAPTDEEMRVMRKRHPFEKRWTEIEEEICASIPASDPEGRENMRWFRSYTDEWGLFGNRPGNKIRAEFRWWRNPVTNEWERYRSSYSIRRWIERFVRIETTAGNVEPMVLNPPQRHLLSVVLRMMRAGVPVRVRILKSRQQGASTFIQALAFQCMMSRPHFKALLIANREDVARSIVSKVGIMARRIAREDGTYWRFKFSSKAKDAISFADPLYSQIKVESAESDEPGHGFTCQFLHASETSRWPKADIKAKGVDQILHNIPGTFGFDESTANGDSGYFRRMWWKGWEERDLPYIMRTHSPSVFYPWFWSPNYRWTVSTGRQELDARLREEIEKTLDDRERWLLQQTYPARGKPGLYRRVDFDQLAWRRTVCAQKCGSNWDTFDEQYPDTPDVAFLTSGRSIFDIKKIREQQRAMVCEPQWLGDILPSKQTRVGERPPGIEVVGNVGKPAFPTRREYGRRKLEEAVQRWNQGG